MRSIASLLVLLVCSPVAGGELFDSSPWSSAPPTAIGSKAFDDLMSWGPAEDGATIAYVDFFGTASFLSIYTGVREQADIRNALTIDGSSVAWLREVATSPLPQPIEDGWTRFDFRSLKLLSVPFGVDGPNFEGGRGPFFRAEEGSFSAIEGFEQNPGPPVGEALYFELPNSIPKGPRPVFRVIWETLDAPYVSRTGDANWDGSVDFSDFGVLKANYGKAVDRWMVADFDGDGLVSGGDFGVLKEHFGQSASAAVPEPTGFALATLAVLAVLSSRSKPSQTVCPRLLR